MVFQIVAIAVLTAFYGCYILKMLSQRKKGIQTDQMGKGKVGLVKFIEVTMKISAILVFGAAGFCAADGAFSYPGAEHLNQVFYGTGDVFASALMGAMICGKTTGEATRIAVDFTHEAMLRTLENGLPLRYGDRKSTRLNSSHCRISRMPSSA